jgi:putative membrane protein
MKEIASLWSIDAASLMTFFITLSIAFFVKRKSGSNTALVLGFLLLLLCLFSPLHLLSAHYLFSAHMTVHIVLLLLVGPLLVLSRPADKQGLSTFFLFLKEHPVTGWLAGIAVMWCWHVPVLFNYNMAVAHEQSLSLVSVLENLSLITAGVLFSAPVLHPATNYRIDALSGVVYLFTACIGCSLLGLLITFAPPGTYHHFLSRHDAVGLNKIIVQDWGITQAVDQQAAGLIMWVPCCFLYVSGAVYLLAQWFRQKEEPVFEVNKG